MERFFRSRENKIGLAPGTLVHVGKQKLDRMLLQSISYDEVSIIEKSLDSVDELTAVSQPNLINWINIVGLHQVDLIEKIGQAFNIHPLLLEDILNTNQRPKWEGHNQQTYIIVKMLHWQEANAEIVTEQLAIVLGSNFVLTFQEQEQDLFDKLRERLREGNGRIRKTNADYLAYAILDAVVDQYFFILEKLGDKLEAVEDELLNRPTTSTLQQIHQLKREMLFMRKSVWPLRELLNELQRGDGELFDESTLIYLRDVYDHAIQVADMVETFRGLVSSMLDLYLSTMSNRMNEVMKLLTIIATFFIPLTFITSIYGMNFAHMPELQSRWGYPLIWLIMVSLSCVMWLYFKRKDWL